MTTLIIKNVDFNKLDTQRQHLNRVLDLLPDGEAKDSVRGIRNMLNEWSDERYHKSLGSKSNQEAKERQLNLPGTSK